MSCSSMHIYIVDKISNSCFFAGKPRVILDFPFSWDVYKSFLILRKWYKEDSKFFLTKFRCIKLTDMI